MVSFNKARQKLKLELLLMWPFVVLGKIYGKMVPLKYPVDFFFFFPNADIGGSPKVNLDIVECIKRDKKCLIIFSKRPKNNLFAERFKALGVPIIDLQSKIDNKLFHFINFFYRGVIASWIKAQQHPTVFGGECIFLYKIVPHLPKKVKTVELIHLATWIEYSMVFASYLDIRICSTLNLMREVESVYSRTAVPAHFKNRLRFVDNAIDIPDNKPVENELLQVIFVGRGSAQKRPELIAKIAEILHEKQAPVHFSFIGDVELVFDPLNYPFCTFYGNIKQEDILMDIYAKSDALMLTSAFEGLPIVVMQMMAYGKIVVSTAVGGIPDYINNGVNGYLISNKVPDKIIQEGVAVIENILTHKDDMKKMGAVNKIKAIQLFSHETFCRNFRELLIES